MSLTKRQLRQTRHVREKGHWNFFCQLIAGGIAVAESSCSTGVNGSRQARLKIENQYNYRNRIGGSYLRIDFGRLFQKKIVRMYQDRLGARRNKLSASKSQSF